MGFFNECIHLDVLFPFRPHTIELFMAGSDINSATVWAVYLKWTLGYKSANHTHIHTHTGAYTKSV